MDFRITVLVCTVIANLTICIPISAQGIEWDLGNGNVGIGTGSPSAKLHVKDGDLMIEQSAPNESAVINFVTSNSSWEIKQNGITGRLTFFSPGGGAATASFKFAPQAQENLFRVGVINGDTVDINGKLIINGTNVTPDYVFNSDYPLESIEEHSEFMWKNKHLPALPGFSANAGGVDIVSHQYGTLEELEKAHIYIGQLNEKLKKQSKTIKEQNDRLAQLELALAKLMDIQISEIKKASIP